MKVKFICNACAVIESDKGTKILTDPWLDDGVFEGSWCHFHKLKTKVKDLQDVDAIYVSHVHPDHYDSRFFNYPKDIPIIVLDHGFNFLHKNLIAQGYTNLLKVKDGETLPFKDFQVTCYAPFVKNNFFEENTKIGNLIDSAIVLQADDQVVFNANDNNPDVSSCEFLREKFGEIDFAMMNYNNAGPYPSCFENLTLPEKLLEHSNNLSRNIDFLADNLKALKPKYLLPFAGAYVIGGNLHQKNECLGTTTWDDCIERLQERDDLGGVKFVALRETGVFDVTNDRPLQSYVPIDSKEVSRYISEELSLISLPYEQDDYPDLDDLFENLELSKIRLVERMKKIHLEPDMKVDIEVGQKIFNVVDPVLSKGTLQCKLDTRLLKRILLKESHWNNAEIGCHIEFHRSPNHYSPDIHTMMQFFHL